MSIWLRKVLLLIRPRMIRNRFLLAMIMLSVPPLMVLGYFSFTIVKDTLVENHIQKNEYHLKTTSEVADLFFRNVTNMHRLILANNDLRSEVIASGLTDNPDAAINIRTANRLQNVAVSNLIDTSHVQSICLFDLKFRSVCYGSGLPRINDTEDMRGKIASSDWYRKTLQAEGKEVFFSYDVLQMELGNNSFSSVKLLRDPSGYQPIGLLVINLKKTMFKQVINEGGDSDFVVLEASNSPMNVIYHQGPGLFEDFSIYPNQDAALQHIQENGYLFSQYINKTTGWTFLHIMEESTLLKDSERIGTATVWIIVFIAFVALLFSLYISGSITRPLLQLKRMMMDWAKGSQFIDVAFEDDEVGAIGKTFKQIASENQMLNERLLHSKLREREAELRSLESQIKPHFLYNTLDSIYWMAVLHEVDDIAQMADSLSESFKLSLNKGKETIPVYKELKHIEHYLVIQNLRYNHRFQYVCQVDPELMEMEMLKLLLQPLVENAIYHGLEPKGGEGTISLKGTLEAGYATFTVEDNGVGISDVSVIEQGYGMGNVRERLMLYYGPCSSFSIHSEPGQGTTVTLRFQVNRELDMPC